MDIYYKVKPGSPTWKRVLEFEEKRDRVFEIQKKVLTKLGIAAYKRFGGVFYSMNVLPVTFTSEEAKVGWKKVRGENHYKLGSGDWVVRVENVVGGVSLDHLSFNSYV